MSHGGLLRHFCAVKIGVPCSGVMTSAVECGADIFWRHGGVRFDGGTMYMEVADQ